MIAFQTFVSALISSLHILLKPTHVDMRLANMIYKHKLQLIHKRIPFLASTYRFSGKVIMLMQLHIELPVQNVEYLEKTMETLAFDIFICCKLLGTNNYCDFNV